MRNVLKLFPIILLTGCGTITVPAAVQTSDGIALIGTTTAAISGGVFSVSTADQKIRCGGTYDALDTSPTISVPFTCSDGRYGNAIVTRARDGMSGSGSASLSDGSTAQLAFGNGAGSVLSTAASGSGSFSAFQSPAVTETPQVASDTARIYSGNCPTPDSVDAAGKRCGDRSAASRAGGYNGYGSWAGTGSYGGTVNVRGYYRKGHYVRSYTRRR